MLVAARALFILESMNAAQCRPPLSIMCLALARAAVTDEVAAASSKQALDLRKARRHKNEVSASQSRPTLQR